MKRYQTTQTLRLFGGLVGLTDRQAQTRSHFLQKMKTGIYEIVSPVEFKAGETIRLDKPDKITRAMLIGEDEGRDEEQQTTTSEPDAAIEKS